MPLKYTESVRTVKDGTQYTFRAPLKPKGFVKFILLNPTPEQLSSHRRQLCPSQPSLP